MTSGILVDFLFLSFDTTKKTPKCSIDKIANGKTAIIEKKYIYSAGYLVIVYRVSHIET